MAGKELLIGISLIGIYVKAHNDQPSVCFKYVFLRMCHMHVLFSSGEFNDVGGQLYFCRFDVVKLESNLSVDMMHLT
jgi:hypothetical protein